MATAPRRPQKAAATVTQFSAPFSQPPTPVPIATNGRPCPTAAAAGVCGAPAGIDQQPFLHSWWSHLVALLPFAQQPALAPPAAAAASAIAPATAPDTARAPAAITLGCALPLSGDGAANGLAAQAAVRMAAARFAPGVAVSVRCVDSRCVDVLAYNAVEQLAGDAAVIGIVGDVCSGASVAAAGRANDLGMPIISPTSTASALSTLDWFFRVAPNDAHQAAMLARLAHSSGARSLGIAHDTTTYGYGLSQNFIAAFTKLPGSSVIAAAADMTAPGGPAAAAKKLAGASPRPDALLVSTGNASLAASFLLAAQQAGLVLPTYAGDGLADAALGQALLAGPNKAAGAAVLGRLRATQLTPGSAAFQAEFGAFTNGSVPYRVAAAHAYDAAAALLRAYADAAPPKGRAQVRAALQHQHFGGATGPVAFDANGDLSVPAGGDAREYMVVGFDPASGQLRVVAGAAGGRVALRGG